MYITDSQVAEMYQPVCWVSFIILYQGQLYQLGLLIWAFVCKPVGACKNIWCLWMLPASSSISSSLIGPHCHPCDRLVYPATHHSYKSQRPTLTVNTIYHVCYQQPTLTVNTIYHVCYQRPTLTVNTINHVCYQRPTLTVNTIYHVCYQLQRPNLNVNTIYHVC